MVKGKIDHNAKCKCSRISNYFRKMHTFLKVVL